MRVRVPSRVVAACLGASHHCAIARKNAKLRARKHHKKAARKSGAQRKSSLLRACALCLSVVRQFRIKCCCYLSNQELPLGTWCSGITSAQHAGGPGFNPQRVHARQTGQVVEAPDSHQMAMRASVDNASAGNRTRVTSMATMYSATRPLMLLCNVNLVTASGNARFCP